MKKTRPGAQNRTRKITIRFTPEEYQELHETIQATNLKLSEYIRKRVIGKKIIAKTDIQCIAQIHKAGVNLNQIARIINQENTIKDVKNIEYQIALIRNQFTTALETLKK